MKRGEEKKGEGVFCLMPRLLPLAASVACLPVPPCDSSPLVPHSLCPSWISGHRCSLSAPWPVTANTRTHTVYAETDKFMQVHTHTYARILSFPYTCVRPRTHTHTHTQIHTGVHTHVVRVVSSKEFYSQRNNVIK